MFTAADVLRSPAHGVAPALQIICGDKDPQLYRSQRMHELLDELVRHLLRLNVFFRVSSVSLGSFSLVFFAQGIEHGYREADDVGHDSGRIYPFFAMVGFL